MSGEHAGVGRNPQGVGGGPSKLWWGLLLAAQSRKGWVLLKQERGYLSLDRFTRRDTGT